VSLPDTHTATDISKERRNTLQKRRKALRQKEREKKETIQIARNRPEEDKKEFLLNLNRMSYPTTPQYSTKTSLFYNPTPPKKMPWFDGVRNAVVCVWFVEWICCTQPFPTTIDCTKDICESIP
jgi:Zn-dependent M16 (insulinase) family peptidase